MDLLLAIETSCDETAAAVLRGTGDLLGSSIASQAAVHATYGGVVPEVASRNHLSNVQATVDEALVQAGMKLSDMDAFAATMGPGLASALLVGASAAKGFSLALNRPFVAVNHIEGHLLSPFFGCPEIPKSIGLVVSGGHSLLVDIFSDGCYRLLGRTLDDAAGEAFDKAAKLLGLGYPGGPAVEAEARNGDPARFAFPRGMNNSGDFNFSFSGLKTALKYALPKTAPDDRPDVCASFQEAIVEVLVQKSVRAAQENGRDLIAVSGGVCLNARLRESLENAAAVEGLGVIFAEPQLCTDNAVMIAHAAARARRRGESSMLTFDIFPSLGEGMFRNSLTEMAP